ncbi:MAG TPA: hypothetical protein VNB94_12285 [Mycobacteriales bacterium]|nr:hypothetical protein [Mycobacteriales bacterium]
MITAAEHHLVEALQAEAHAAPPAGDLLRVVRARARQRSRRRVATGSAIAAVAVVASGAVVRLDRDDTLRVPQPYTSPEAPAPAPASPFEPGALPRLTFPVTPRWLPAGVHRTPRVSLADSGFEASYDDASRPRYMGVDIWSSDRDVSPTGPEAARRATTVNGHPATLTTFADTVALSWQTTPGSWRVVMAGNSWGEESVVRRVAESLAEEPLEVHVPLELGLMPRDAAPAQWSTDGSVILVPRDKHEAWKAGDGDVPGVVLIAARRARADLTGRGEEVTVTGHRGWLMRQGNARYTLVLVLTDQMCLVIDTPAWSRQDVLRFAEATRYTGGLLPQEG